MKRLYYQCEDCGHEFQDAGFPPDIEDGPLACPSCGGMDIQLLEKSLDAEAA